MKFRFVLSISALAVVACGEDEQAPVTQLEPVCAYFSVLRPRNDEAIALPDLCPPPVLEGAGGTGAEEPSDPVPSELLSVVLGADRQLGVDVSAEPWTFRPPHACGDAAQCGYVVVELDPGIELGEDGTPIGTRLARAESAINTVTLDLSGVTESIDGYHMLQATLMNADRTPFFGLPPITYSFILTTDDGTGPEEPDGSAGGGAGGAGGEAGGAGGEAPR